MLGSKGNSFYCRAISISTAGWLQHEDASESLLLPQNAVPTRGGTLVINSVQMCLRYIKCPKILQFTGKQDAPNRAAQMFISTSMTMFTEN